MSYHLNVIKDNPMAFWPLDESIFSNTIDISGSGNNGSYVGTFSGNIMPLVYGGSNATKITNTSYVTCPVTKNFYKEVGKGGFATSDYSDNSFSLEIWLKQNISSGSMTPIFADSTNNIGLFYFNGNIIFKVNSQSLIYKLSFAEKAMHIVACYGTNSMSIYVDGSLATSRLLESFKFTNNTLSIACGPTNDAQDYFLIDAPAIYRYKLSAEQIAEHFNSGLDHTQPIHIVAPDNGILLGLHGQNIAPVFIYQYNKDVQWQSFIDENTYYDEVNKYISFKKSTGPKTFIINDVFNVPTSTPIISSKIEWKGDKNITVESSIDNTTWVQCINGSSLPQFNKENYTGDSLVYIRITMTTDDSEIDFPRLSLFRVLFYSKKELYAHNYGYYATSEKEYDAANFSYPVLIRHPNVGLKTCGTGGFKVDIDLDISTVEFMFTPTSLADNMVFYCPDPESKFGWAGNTAIKSNISKVYINEEDVTSVTNIKSKFVLNEPHHVVLVLSSPAQNVLQFNYLSNTNYGPVCNYQNIGLYQYQFVPGDVAFHYDTYCGKPSISVSDSSLGLTESGVTTYNQDYLIVSSA